MREIRALGEWHPLTGHIILATMAAVLPRVVEIPVWTTAYCLFCWGWSLAGIRGLVRRPWPLARRLMTIIPLLGVLATYAGSFNLSSGASYLAILLAVKPMENETRRDVVVGVYLILFFNVFNVFSSQSVLMGMHLFLSCGLTMAVLAMSANPGFGLKQALKTTALLGLRGLPVMVVLFLVFPRLPGGLVNFSSEQNRTGFDPVLELGAVGRLAQDRSTAFRVEFLTGPPPMEELYWRGLVLWHFDGERWYPMNKEPAAMPLQNPDGLVEYDMIIEPHRGNHVFSLDIPAEPPERTLFTASRTIFVAGAGRRRLRLRMQSYLRAEMGPLYGWESAALELPPTGNQRARDLARSWRDNAGSDSEIVKAALSMFRTQPFHYSLDAPPLAGDTVDMFLFTTRTGFCEHYAASFTFLMRAAGLPARIVVGYQGGELNPVGNYVTVRQSDAHAWSEVWLEGRGWTRVDPTAAVAPERVHLGAAQVLPQEDSWWNRVVFGEGSPLERFRFAWDSINFYWTRAVVEHSFGRQRRFLEWLGIRFGMGRTALLLVGGLSLGAFLAVGPLLWRGRSGRDGRDRARIYYDRFCDRFGRMGLPREPWQGPVEYGRALCERFPAEVDDIWRFIDRYVALRYGHVEEGELAARLRELKASLRR